MTTTTYFATQHSIDRAMERINLNEREAMRKIDIALQRGKCAENYTSSRERKYLENQSHNAIAVAFDNFCYLFSYQGECITVYALPDWWEKKKLYNGKEKIRKPKKYFSYFLGKGAGTPATQISFDKNLFSVLDKQAYFSSKEH